VEEKETSKKKKKSRRRGEKKEEKKRTVGAFPILKEYRNGFPGRPSRRLLSGLKKKGSL